MEVREARERVEGQRDLGGPREDATVSRLDQLVKATTIDELQMGFGTYTV